VPVQSLATIFADAGGERGDTGDGLEAVIAALCKGGRSSHPALDLDDASFVAHLGRCGAPVAEARSKLYAGDLFLACACLMGNAAAVAQLQAECAPVLGRYLKRVERSAEIREEVEQRLWDELLVGGEKGPKLATYSGRGPLGVWIAISGQRIALMMLRHERAESRARNEAAARSQLADADPEMAAIKEHYRPQFQEAVESAIAALDVRDKNIYRMYLVEGVTLERIAKAYGVTHPTVLRWLDRARRQVLDESKRRLREKLLVSSSDFESIARLLASQLDLNISHVLSK
jgi:RNA polymerase sigma-70 factor (ECF subfamily)